LKTPSDARARKYKVWGELHGKIFSGQSVEPYIIAALLSRFASDWLRVSPYAIGDVDVERIIAKRGSFHVARIAAFLLRGNDEWKITRPTLQRLIEKLETHENDPSEFLELMDEAFGILLKIITESETYAADADRALKSASLDRDIDKYLHLNKSVAVNLSA